MIYAVTIEIDRRKVNDELLFWKALGYVRVQRTRAMGPSDWLHSRQGIRDYVELVKGDSPLGFQDGRIWIIPPNYVECSRDLDRLQFGVEFWPLDPYFGAQRMAVKGPSGYIVELLSRYPGIHLGGPPSD